MFNPFFPFFVLNPQKTSDFLMFSGGAKGNIGKKRTKHSKTARNNKKFRLIKLSVFKVNKKDTKTMSTHSSSLFTIHFERIRIISLKLLL